MNKKLDLGKGQEKNEIILFGKEKNEVKNK